MDFEFDNAKSLSNVKKHGISFIEAQALWEDEDRAEIPGRRKEEDRYLVIGRIKEKHYSAVVTYRGQCIRIISVRRSRKEEVAIYER